MIDRSEVLAVASDLSRTHDIVEEDYVLGWLLAGIYAHEPVAAAWTFKGGTCLKKCYFETYRFSEDLDFTLGDVAHLDAGISAPPSLPYPPGCTKRADSSFPLT